VANEPVVAGTHSAPIGAGWRRLAAHAADAMPLAGVRVLDLTRVIAGPVCTRVLAAYGADVLRIDPPGFEEVGALLGDTTPGKRRAFLDLRTSHGRDTFERLATTADLLVCGYRASALDGLGLGVDRLRVVNPALSIVALDAYGWTGPWRDRRGFDSLVQMSAGISARSAESMGSASPGALPAQALDHGAGYLLAAAACRALTRRREEDVASIARLSLARVARLLVDLGDGEDPHAPSLASGDAWREREESGFGPLLRVRCPGRIAGVTPRWARPAGPLGVDAPAWSE
jgi:crotonobetainyl-CoA:carnitine CoA-transferase CaiB-like acyl-CoA transferase